MNLSTSVPSAPGPRLEVDIKAEERAQPLPPIAVLVRKAEQHLPHCKKVELQALLAHYPEDDIRHYALALDMKQRMQEPYPIADNYVKCQRGHTFWVGTPGMLFRNRKTYCKDCGRDVSVVLTPKPQRTKEQKAHAAERAAAALASLKKGS